MTSTGVFRARAAWPHLERAPHRQRIEDLKSAYEYDQMFSSSFFFMHKHFFLMEKYNKNNTHKRQRQRAATNKSSKV